MFSQVCVKNSVLGGGMHGKGGMDGGGHMWQGDVCGRGCAWQGGCMAGNRVHGREGCAW